MNDFDILVIDDEEVIIDSILKVGKVENLAIDTALSGTQGLGKINEFNYKLIVCDLILPDINGFEIVQKVVSNNITTPIIVTTGYSTIDNAIKAMQYGAIDFLPKPFTFDEILGCIRKGMRYSKIISDRVVKIGFKNSSPLLFIPCPPSYYRFGLTSWLSIEKEFNVRCGLTDLNMRTIDDIEILNTADKFEGIVQGQEYLTIVCKQGIEYKILAPVSGKILEINENVLKNSRLLEKDPFFEGWIYKIVASDLENELKFLTSCSTDRL
jgi:YesN/AraC family two-component response regulator